MCSFVVVHAHNHSFVCLGERGKSTLYVRCPSSYRGAATSTASVQFWTRASHLFMNNTCKSYPGDGLGRRQAREVLLSVCAFMHGALSCKYPTGGLH